MSTYTLPLFGTIDLATPEDYYYQEIAWEGQVVSLDLNCWEGTLKADQLAFVKDFLENLTVYDSRNKAYMATDFETNEWDTVRFYIENFLEAMNDEDIAAYADIKNTSLSVAQQLVSKLHLIRVGFYPDKEDPTSVFDYSLDEENTNYLIVITLSPTRKLLDMTIES